MHEMTIAQSIIDIVQKEASVSENAKVKELELEIGVLAGIEYEALEFALKVIAPGSIIEGAHIVIDKPGGLAVCNDCNKDFDTESPINLCPKCGSYSCSILKGKELRVSSILIE
ncbi:MAG: hydrogenase maturation nickel metallochaperone HypA [Bacteroidales bacterium]|nr:hydrogenase maturation nickel metallochaperone HypA [Bacteroidales bacterium]